MQWYRKGAEQGEPHSENSIGNLYKNGFGVKKDYQEAMKWFEKAAAQGDPDAKKSIAKLKVKMPI
jgi:hypothetical protein